MANMWGNNAADVDIRLLLHDYPTIIWQGDDEPAINPAAVTAHDRLDRPDGGRVYTFTLKDGLRYSDGSAITAHDYVFSVLLQASPAMGEIGGMNLAWSHLAGAEAYTAGESTVFAGVRLLDERRFSLEVSGEYLPYFYELSYVQVQPYPAAAIIPGCEVRDDGKGAYIAGTFGAALLQETILNRESGYLSQPKVTSGAYKLLHCDTEARTAAFELNPYYAGNGEGRQPAIRRILFREILNEDIAPALADGQVHLVHKISAADTIDAVNALPADAVRALRYPRNGLAYLGFAAERPLPASQQFRQAIARMLNQEDIAARFLRNNGQPVYGYYSLAQWMPWAYQGDLKALDRQPYDLAAAEALLQADGWTLDAAGQPYQAGAAGLRHRLEGETLVPLSPTLALAHNNQAGEIVRESLEAALLRLGGRLEVIRLPMSDLLRQFYRQEQRRFDMVFLATNFGPVFDPYLNYRTDDAHQGSQNTSGLKDDTLMTLARALRETAPGDSAAFLSAWAAFQDRWADLLPLVPLYTNTYVDAFTPRLTGYQPENYSSWADAILYAAMDEY